MRSTRQRPRRRPGATTNSARPVAVEFSQHVHQLLPDPEERAAQTDRAISGSLLHGIWLLPPLAQALASPGNRKPVGVQQVLDLEQLVHVLARVDALALARLLRSNRTKLGFPVTQD